MAKKQKAKAPKKKVLAFHGRKPKGGSTSPRLNTGRRAKPEIESRIDVLEDAGSALDLGPITLPPMEEAVTVLRELAEMNDQVLHAQRRYVDAAAVAKKLKGEWDHRAELLSKRLRLATHAPALPLFDAAQQEADRAAAVVDQVGEGGQDAATAGVDAPGTIVDAPEGVSSGSTH